MGPEYISGKLLISAEKQGIAIQFIQPGQPQHRVMRTPQVRETMARAHIERCNRMVRHGWLDRCIIETIETAQDHTTQWPRTCNIDRPNIDFTPAMKLKMAA